MNTSNCERKYQSQLSIINFFKLKLKKEKKRKKQEEEYLNVLMHLKQPIRFSIGRIMHHD